MPETIYEICYCSECGPLGRDLAYKTYQNHQNRELRKNSHTSFADLTAIPTLARVRRNRSPLQANRVELRRKNSSSAASGTSTPQRRVESDPLHSPIRTDDALPSFFPEDPVLLSRIQKESDMGRASPAYDPLTMAVAGDSGFLISDDARDMLDILGNMADLDWGAAEGEGDDEQEDEDENDGSSNGPEALRNDIDDTDSASDAQTAMPHERQTPLTPPLAPNENRNIPLIWTTISESDDLVPDPLTSVSRKKEADIKSLKDTHHHHTIQILYLLVSWLHSQFHVPYRAIEAILYVVGVLFLSLGSALDPTVNVAATFTTVQKHMGIEPNISILPVCPSCMEVYPADSQTPDCCQRCNAELFKSAKTRSGKDVRGDPLLQYPFMPLSSQLQDLLQTDGLEELLDAWRQEPRTEGVYNDIFDGRVAKEVLDSEGRPFFRNTRLEQKSGPHSKPGPEGELRIGVTLGADW